MASKAYLVMGDNGQDYEDNHKWPVKVFFHPHTARIFMGQLKERVDWLVMETSHHEETYSDETSKRVTRALRSVTKLDPDFPDYNAKTTTYFMAVIPIEERN